MGWLVLLGSGLASAGDMSWTCVTPTSPEDAYVYVEAETSAASTALDLALAWMTCTPATCDDPEPSSTACEEAACTTAEGAVVSWREETVWEKALNRTFEQVDISVEPSSEAWTSLVVSRLRVRATYGLVVTYTASWAGEVDASWPADGSFTVEDVGVMEGDGSNTSAMSWDDGTCAWSWNRNELDGEVHTVRVGTDEVYVDNRMPVCGSPASAGPFAWFDDVLVGEVDASSWALVYPDGDGDGCTSSLDCDDADATISPESADVPSDGIDQDCDGVDYADPDGDGSWGLDDCGPSDASIYPGAPETPYDGIDQDCDGADSMDADGDGVDLGEDCDDGDATVHPGAPETWNDGIDQDCDGADTVDADGDGWASAEDCDEGDPSIHPDADDIPYDGIDQDCDGADTTDADGDGWVVGEDCDDADPSVYPGAWEVTYDGVDQDCDGEDLDDFDGDGFSRGDDCDDADPDRYPGAPETWNDGIDQDCDGADSVEEDGDGWTTSEDCDDADPSVQGDCEAAERAPDGGGCGRDDAGRAGLLALLLPAAWRRRRPGAGRPRVSPCRTA